MEQVTASDLARNTRAILERVVGGDALRVMRNRAEIAHLVPARRTMTAAEAIAGLVGTLTSAEDGSWLRDSRGDFDHEVRDPWE